MNINVEKTDVCIPDLFYKGTEEIPIDFDFTLPDYCPDIGKILKCQIAPCVLSRNISGDRLLIEGNVKCELLYLELEKNILRCYATESPFSRSIDLRSSPISAIALIEPKIQYLNCRAVNPRRVDIHGAFVLNNKILGKKNVEVSTQISDEKIEKLKRNIDFSNLISLNQEILNINEVLDLGSDKPPAEFIIKSFFSLDINSYNFFENKLNIKGELSVRILYLSDIETGKLENIEYEVPINQELEIPGTNSESSCILKAEIVNHEEKISSDNNEEINSNLINIDVKILFNILCFEKRNEEIILDVYDLDNEVNIVKDTINYINFEETKHEELIQKVTIDTNENKVLKVLDIWPKSIKTKIKKEDNHLFYDIKVSVCLLGLNADSMAFYEEKEIELSKEPKDLNDIVDENLIDSQINSIGYKISGDNQINLKIKILINADIIDNFSEEFVNEVIVDENRPRIKDPDTALAIYYASPGENIWDIAKKYGTTVEKIKEENEIDLDTIENKKAVLIPII
ncbi:MAG: DUF3794 domain-containing protein [Candidatus Improbicoccus pseudotrichonymphae]|uniref:DUF3794 domain-containing protein n=1 Tax=Candidatus Improbicoccus pseudotrichonymphae TaxID=3033792 RepID=A0AA48HVN0_9FIRM|nr:MAG: DUF3794 domain-containing protein [Candidatus Improbicoccus pseudotrichonymphae]